jgi:cell division protein FtsX
MKEIMIDKLSALAAAAFGLVAALAWNNAIQEVFKQFFGTAQTLWAMIGYAALVTVIAVLITIWIGKLAEKAKTKKK